MTNVTVLTDLTTREWCVRYNTAIENSWIEYGKLIAAPKHLRVIHEVNVRHYIGQMMQAREAILAFPQSRIGKAA
jgi:hypothetical protein